MERCAFLLKEAPQSSSGHTKGFSPVWMRRCARKWADLVKVLLHVSSLQTSLVLVGLEGIASLHLEAPSASSAVAISRNLVTVKFQFLLMAGPSPCKAALARFSPIRTTPRTIHARTLMSGDIQRLIHGNCTSFYGGTGHSNAWVYKPSGMNHNHGKKDISQLFRLSRFAMTQKCHRRNLKRLGL